MMHPCLEWWLLHPVIRRPGPVPVAVAVAVAVAVPRSRRRKRRKRKNTKRTRRRPRKKTRRRRRKKGRAAMSCRSHRVSCGRSSTTTPISTWTNFSAKLTKKKVCVCVCLQESCAFISGIMASCKTGCWLTKIHRFCSLHPTPILLL